MKTGRPPRPKFYEHTHWACLPKTRNGSLIPAFEAALARGGGLVMPSMREEHGRLDFYSFLSQAKRCPAVRCDRLRAGTRMGRPHPPNSPFEGSTESWCK